MKKKKLLISLIIIVLIPILLYTVLRTSYVQNYLAQKITTYLSNQLETEISVKGVDVTFFLNIVLEDISVKDQHDEQILFAEELIFNTGRISFKERFLEINKLCFENAEIRLVKYPDAKDYNFQFIIEYFDKKQPPEYIARWAIVCKSFEFNNSEFELQNMNKPKKKGQFDANNIFLSQLDIDISDVFIEEDAFSASVSHISFKESNGFIINDFSGDIRLSETGSRVENMMLKTNSSMLSMDVSFEYASLDDFNDFAEKVSFDFDLQPSSLGFIDIGFFFGKFADKNKHINMKGNLSGKISNFNGRDFLLTYGNSTLLDGNFFITGMPDYNNTFVHLSINKFRTIRKDIGHFAEIVEIKPINSQFYEYLYNLGNVLFTGSLTGFINDFVAYGDLQTDIGNIKSDIAFFDNKPNDKIGYKGSFAAQNFNVGKFLGEQNTIGEVSLDFFVEGAGITTETANVELTGGIDHLSLLDYNYQDIKISGNLANKKVNGSLTINDPNAAFDFAGMIDFNESPYIFNCYTNINNADLTQLNLYQRDSIFNSLISADLVFNLKASNFDDMEGDVNIKSATYSEVSIDNDSIKNKYHFGDINISNHTDVNDKSKKAFKVSSDFIDIKINGDVKINKIKASVNNFLAAHMPSYYKDSLPKPFQKEDVNIEYMIDIKNASPLTEVFLPQLSIAKGSMIEGYFNDNGKQLTIRGDIPKIAYNNNIFYDLKINGKNIENKYSLELSCNRLMLSDSVWLDNLMLNNTINDDSLSTVLKWENKDSDKKNKGWIEGITHFHGAQKFDIRFLDSFVFINDILWQVNSDHIVKIDSTSYDIDNFIVFKDKEYATIDGKISHNPKDQIILNFSEFDVARFDWFFENRNISFDGIINGNVIMADFFGTPDVTAGVEVIDFGFNDSHLGNLIFSTNYDHEINGFEVFMEIVDFDNIGHNKPLVSSGYYYPDKDDNNFDLDITLNNLNMSIIGRYLDSFAENFHGMASGNLNFEGPSLSPELTGNVDLSNMGFKAEYLNTSYTFAHENFEVGKNYFSFKNMILYDTLGNQAIANGDIYHNHFRDFELDIEIFPNSLMLLNTTSSSTEPYYGSAFASGRGHIHGPEDDITIDIAVRTNRNTKVYLPLDYKGEVAKSNYITFISKDDASKSLNSIEQIERDYGGLTLNFDLEVTPDAEVQLIFDSQIGDIIYGRGYGDINMEITSQGSFNMYGDYTIEEGDYLFTLQNMLNKRFKINKGSSINWTGDLFDAEVDLQAFYRVRTPLYEIVKDIDTSDIYKRRIPVDVALNMKEKLINPNIYFDIRLPQSDELTREMVNRAINTEQEMNRQIFSLLVLNRFMPKDDRFNNVSSRDVGTTSTEMLSNQVSNWLSQISSEFDIGVNYRPGDEISSQELEVALSTQLLDDRLVIDGNVGVASENKTVEQSASNIIGDVNIEYKITPEGRFRVKAFNRSSTIDLLNTNSLYTQGVGFFYRKEFDSLKDLLKKEKEINDGTNAIEISD